MKLQLRLIIMMIGAMLLASCTDDIDDPVTIDYTPINFRVTVRNAEGMNLLDPSVADNLLSDVSVSYNGKTYLLNMTSVNVKSRAVLATWRGVRLNDNYTLEIGQFDGGAETGGCVLHIGSRQYELSYTNKFNHNQVVEDRTFYLDGKEVGKGTLSGSFTITIE